MRDDPYIPLSEAAKKSGYTAEYLRQLCVSGKLQGKKLGKIWVTTQEDLNQFLGITRNDNAVARDPVIRRDRFIGSPRITLSSKFSLAVLAIVLSFFIGQNYQVLASQVAAPIPDLIRDLAQASEILDFSDNLSELADNYQAVGREFAQASGVLDASESISELRITLPRLARLASRERSWAVEARRANYELSQAGSELFDVSDSLAVISSQVRQSLSFNVAETFRSPLDGSLKTSATKAAGYAYQAPDFRSFLAKARSLASKLSYSTMTSDNDPEAETASRYGAGNDQPGQVAGESTENNPLLVSPSRGGEKDREARQELTHNSPPLEEKFPPSPAAEGWLGEVKVTQVIREINNYTLKASLTEAELTDMIIKSDSLKSLLKGEKGERGETGSQGPQGLAGSGISYVLSPSNPSTVGSVGGVTYFGTKDLTAEKATFTSDINQTGGNATLNTLTVTNGTTTTGNQTISGNLTVNGNTTLGDNASDTITLTGTILGASPLVLEGLTANDFETTIALTDPTADRTITIPNNTGTLTLTTNDLSVFAATTSAQLAGVISDETGSGLLVFATSPTLTTPTLGVATATTINKVTITAPATAATLTIAEGKTLTASNTLTFTGTDASSVAFGGGGTVTYTANNLSVFAATTSAQLAGVISDETGSGLLVFATSPTLTTPTIGAATGSSLTLSTGGALRTSTADTNTALLQAYDVDGAAYTTFGTLTAGNTPTFNLASGVTLGGNTIATTNLTLASFAATTSAQLAGVISDETGSGALVFGTSPTITTSLSQDGDVADAGYLRLQNAAIIGWEASPAGVDITLTVDASEIMQASGTFNAVTLTEGAVGVPNVNDNLSVFAATTSAQLAGVSSDETGSGLLVFATSPTLTTPTLGVATATTINKVTITAPATAATLTIAEGKTLTASNTLTFTGTDASSVAFGGGGTVAYTANNLSVFAATTSAQLAGVISDETGSGALVLATSPTLTTPTLGAASATSVTTSGQGALQLGPFGAAAGNTAESRFLELAASGVNYVGFKAPDAITANVIWTLPSADATSSGQALTSNASGVLSWTSVSSAWSGISAPTANLSLAHAGNTTSFTFNSVTTATAFSLSSSSLTTGILLDLSNTSTTATSSDLLQLDHTATYTTAQTVSGQLLDLSRALTINAGATTLTVSGAVASITDNCTQTLGTCTSTADVLTITQSYASNSGAALNVTTAGTGLAFRVNDDGTLTDTTPFVVDASGNVGIGNTTPGKTLDVTGEIRGTTRITVTSGLSQTAVSINGTTSDLGLEINNSGTSGRNYQLLSNNNLSGVTAGTFRLYDATAGADRLVINSSGNVGIGTTTVDKALQIYRSDTSDKQLAVEQASTGDAAMVFRLPGVVDWTVGLDNSDSDSFKFATSGALGTSDRMTITTGGNVIIGATAILGTEKVYVKSSGTSLMRFDRTTSDGTLVDFDRDGVDKGSISVSGETVSYNAFTGSHYAWANESIERGMLVTLTGENRHLGNRDDSEVVYGIRKSRKANDPAILGAYLALKEPSLEPSSINPHLVMAVGNGDMWIVDNDQNIEAGDPLISSGTAGHAMKDDGTYSPAYVFAKAAEPIDWSQVSETIDGKKHKKISVLFESFVNRHDNEFNFKTTEVLEQGDLASFTASGLGDVVKTSKNEAVAGVIVSAEQGNKVNLKLSGRAVVKVTEENGAIAPGDRLTVSKTLPGYAMKMTESGQSIGIALENYDNNDNDNKILVFVNLGYQKLEVAAASCFPSSVTDVTSSPAGGEGNNESSCQKLVYDKDIDMSGFSLLNVKAIASISGKWSISEDGTLVAEKIQTKEVCFDDVCLNKELVKSLLEKNGLLSPSSFPSPLTGEGGASAPGEGDSSSPSSVTNVTSSPAGGEETNESGNVAGEAITNNPSTSLGAGDDDNQTEVGESENQNTPNQAADASSTGQVGESDPSDQSDSSETPVNENPASEPESVGGSDEN